MERIWKMKPDSSSAGSSEVSRLSWKARVWESAIVEITRPNPRATGEAKGLPAAAPAVPCACWLAWGELVIPLSDGEHVLGRDPDSLVRIGSTKASRHHARVVVKEGRAVFEDLGSKNNTYLDGRRLEQPTELAHGSEICIGSDVLVFHAPSGTASTETKG